MLRRAISTALAAACPATACLAVAVAPGPVAAAPAPGGGDLGARVVGPDRGPANPADWPFIALQYVTIGASTHLCGASVISPRWLITAAHCAQGAQPSGIAVFPGAYTRASPGPANVPDTALGYPSYSTATKSGDFALLRLPSATSAAAVALPAPSDDAAITAAQGAGAAAQVAGWGLTTCTVNPSDPTSCYPTSVGGPDTTATILQGTAGGVPLLADAACAALPVMGPYVVASTMLCAGNAPPANPSLRNDSCSGDSGGPLTATINGRKVLLGITSWGIRCGNPNLPGVYARVSAARDWICDTVTSPTAITATGGRNSVTVTWNPDTAPCPWRDPQVTVTASPGGATATAALSAGTVTFSGLPRATAYSFSASVVSSSGATPPPATATATTSSVPDPCTQTFYQQGARSWRNQAAPDGTSAVRVLSRIRVYDDAESWCRTSLTFIFRDKGNQKRLSQLPGSTLGYRKLTGRDFSAPVVSWPTAKEFRFEGSDSTGLGRKDARLVLVSYLKRTAGMPAQSNIELVVVRRIPTNAATAESATNPLFAQKNTFGTGVGWATVS